MPTYDYRCLECGKSFEAVQSMKDAPLSECPCEKHSPKVERVISRNAGGFILKGSGFYNTDYKPRSTSGEGNPSSTSTPSTSSSGESSANSSPATTNSGS